jgi:tRNA(His) 5'-end guanylyltransferase
MTSKDSLGDRMKKFEGVFKQELPIRMPVILRCDGKAFHTYTRSLKKERGKPCDPNLEEVMNLTAKKLCEQIQGAQMAYVQSDEISILIHNYKKLTSESWFANQIQKMVSISAAIASVEFTMNSGKIWNGEIKPALFDSRVFVLPENEVVNSFIWRQQDASRNSVQMLARSLFSHKECENKNSGQLMDMCMTVSRNWNDEPVSFKRGRCIVQKHIMLENGTQRKLWMADNDIPVFSKDRSYIEKFLEVTPENEE